ncbi:MAG: hypothetical protein M1820_009240 [Bogoriella megaspora]|nr:MAG: hypothetical protein M1820_009240 [Bogoriella megaspora]
MVECLEVSKYIFEFPRSGSIPGLRKYVSVLNSTLTFKARDKVKHLLLSTGAQYCHPRESQTSRDSASTRPRRQRAAWDFLAGEFPAVESVTIVLDLRDHGPSQLTDDRRIETLISRIMLMASAWKDVQKIILMLRGSDPEPFALSMDMRMRKGYFHRQINEDLILQTCRSRTRTRDWLDEEQYVKIEEKLDKRLRAERKRSAKEGLQAYFEGRMDWSHEERYPMTEGKLYKRLRAERELSAERRRKSHYEGGLMTEKRRKNELR